MTTMTINIVTIVAEVSLVFIFFFLVDWCFGKLYRQILIKLPLVGKSQNSISKIRRNFRGFLFLFGLVLSLAIIAFNGFFIYRGKNVRDYSLKLIRQIPQKFWLALGWGIAKSIGIIIATIIVLRVLNLLLDKGSQYAQNFDGISANDDNVAIFFNTLKSNLNTVSWIAISIICAQFLLLPAIVTKYLYILLRIYVIIIIGLLIFKILAVIIDSLDALSTKYSSPDNLLRFYDQLRHLIPFLKRCLEYIIYVLMATLVVKQLDFIANFAKWGAIGVKLIAIILLSRILISVTNLVVVELLLKSRNLTEVQQQRQRTVIPLFQSVLKYFIDFGAGIFILEIVGIDPGPILAGAGIVGLAVGLGAQNLINDIVSGFFILFENYYLVGDYIETEVASGYVEAIELRTTRIRHHHGQVYIIRNGDINSITNYSKDFIYATVDIGVDYDTNLDVVYDIVQRVGLQLKAENKNILEATQVEGIEEFGDIRLSIRTKTKVKPGRHLPVQLTLRKVLKEAFDREGIYIPIGETTDKPAWATKVKPKEGGKYKIQYKKNP